MTSVGGSEIIGTLPDILKWGPTGLAGLMLILTIIGLGIGTPKPGRERILTRFMYVGGLCFLCALLAQFFAVSGSYKLSFHVAPLDDGAKRVFPEPIIKVNNETLDRKREYLVKSLAVATVDVTDALNFVKEVSADSTRQRETLKGVVSTTDTIIAELQKIPPLVLRICPGGPGGIPAQNSPILSGIATKAVEQLSSLRASGASAIATPQPRVTP